MRIVLLLYVLSGCREVFGLTQPDLITDGASGGDTIGPLSDGGCEGGYKLEGGSCVDLDECALAIDDCSADAACTNQPGTFTCSCNPGFSGDGRVCTRVCSNVLVYDDCPEPGTSCESITQSTYVNNAVTALGLVVKNGGVSDQAAFRTLFDAGNFDVLIIDASRTGLDGTTANRIANWVNGNGRAIVTFWDLDNGTSGETIRTALGVSTNANYTTPRDVYYDPTSTFNVFDRVEQLTSPLTFANVMADDADALSLVSTGRIVARYLSTTGLGAIAITHADRAITVGFLPLEATRDADGDGTPDVTELYKNMIGFLCGY